MQQKYNLIALFLLVCITGLSCKKYLDLKPDKKLTVPSSVKDLQALLDNNNIMNKKYPTYDEASADNYYLPLSNYQSFSLNQRKAYIWQNYDYNYKNDWSQIYDVVYYANEVLHNLKNVERTVFNEKEWDNIKGSALVYRSESFLKAAWIFAKAYDEQTAGNDYGIALRTEPDFDQPVKRSTTRETYAQIVHDLNEAVPLLPDWPVHVMRPSKQAAYALLARTWLSMRVYDSALKYADRCLELNNSLMDYNDLNVDDFFPFPPFNKEVIMYGSIGMMNYPIGVTDVLVDTLLYTSYDNNDLRKRGFFLDASLIFSGITGHLFKGTYVGDFGTLFTGIATDEMYLTRAECYARSGDRDKAMDDINYLLSKRFATGTFTLLQASTADQALDIILAERRKELIFRGLRWMDIKRLNREGANITLKRIIENNTYLLPPNDNRYALPLPADIVSITGMPQNPN